MILFRYLRQKYGWRRKDNYTDNTWFPSLHAFHIQKIMDGCISLMQQYSSSLPKNKILRSSKDLRNRRVNFQKATKMRGTTSTVNNRIKSWWIGNIFLRMRNNWLDSTSHITATHGQLCQLCQAVVERANILLGREHQPDLLSPHSTQVNCHNWTGVISISQYPLQYTNFLGTQKG